MKKLKPPTREGAPMPMMTMPYQAMPLGMMPAGPAMGALAPNRMVKMKKANKVKVGQKKARSLTLKGK